ncbi:MAG: hypothetical protein IPG99_12870 [Ignavibacteria bacterium]|nr:hypothetical protein [Ignavibacteria bacterium]
MEYSPVEEHKNVHVISRNSKLGEMLGKRQIGLLEYKIGEKAYPIEILHTSKYEPNFQSDLDAISGFIMGVDFDTVFQSLKERRKQLEEIESLESSYILN